MSYSLVEPVALFGAFTLTVLWLSRSADRKRKVLQRYRGQCHCGAIKFSCTAPEHLVVWQCDCSFCDMLKNWHFIIPEKDFKLNAESERSLTLYQFNTGVAKHLFCRVCGISPFYRPRSNPDGYAITLACVNSEDIVSYEYRRFDGRNWEKFHGQSGIVSFSKAT